MKTMFFFSAIFVFQIVHASHAMKAKALSRMRGAQDHHGVISQLGSGDKKRQETG